VPSGSAYDFLRDGPAWRTTGKIAAPGRAGELAANDNFGLALAMAESSDTGMLAAIAAALDDLNTTVDAGSVRIIALDDLHPDCNTNSLPDECDIAHGISLDRNDDGVPDECAPIQPCPADVAPPPSGDNTVNIADVLRVISLWGRCAAPPATCPADLDGSGDVDIHDLLAVIAAWGECE
jgi:hypothetical protein